MEDSSKRPRTFSLSSPTQILSGLNDEKRRLTKKERILKDFAENLAQRTSAKNYPVPKIRFIEESKIENFLKQETPKWHNSLENLLNPIWWGFQDHTFVDRYSTWVDWQWKNAPNTVELRMLTNHSGIEKKIAQKYPKRKMKYLGDSSQFQSSLWVIEEFVVVINTQQTPFYLYEIHDELLANDMRELIKKVWES